MNIAYDGAALLMKSLLDGRSSFKELLDASGMGRRTVARYVDAMRKARVIRLVASDCRSPVYELNPDSLPDVNLMLGANKRHIERQRIRRARAKQAKLLGLLVATVKPQDDHDRSTS